jgi:hypothetical protein
VIQLHHDVRRRRTPRVADFSSGEARHSCSMNIARLNQDHYRSSKSGCGIILQTAAMQV